MARRVLLVKANTVLKLSPLQSTELPDAEKHAVSAGTTFEIQSYAYADPVKGDFDGHVKFALKDSSINGRNTWYIYSLHAQIEFDGRVVYPHEDQEALQVLKVTRDTVFKRRPLQTSILPSDEVSPISGGKIYPLHSYAYADAQGNFNRHIKVSLRYEQDFVNELSTWFVYDRHAYVEYDGQAVYPPEDPNLPRLRITEDTTLKRQPVQSSTLSPDQLQTVKKGALIPLNSYAYRDAQGNRFNGHLKIAFEYPKDYIRGMNTWYIFQGHAQVERLGKVVFPSPKPPAPSFGGIPFNLPGNRSTFFTDQPIIPGGSFTWGEATKDATRIPSSVNIVDNIVQLARQLQQARDQLGRIFFITSWYRPPAINAAVGGASQSYHLFGMAADIDVDGLSGRQVANELLLWWPGGLGIYTRFPNIIHLDIGPRRTWGF
ncbi:MAG: YcbK family protein [Elainellaceae cyanobacterium]